MTASPVVPAVDSASVVLIREPSDGGPGVEVLLLERHLDSDFAGGAYVFPGGKLDPGDRQLDPARWTGRPLEQWRSRLGVATTADALGMLVCAVRETFEEAGVLLATREDGTPLSGDDLSRPGFLAARRRLADRSGHWDWRGWLEDEGLTLDLGALAFWAWWVTPEGQHRRFDTRFFIAQLPRDQVAGHDAIEMTDLIWRRPQAALEAQAQGEVSIIFPTRRILAALAAHPDATTAWQAAAAGQVDVRRVQPRIVFVEGRPMVQHPFEDEPSPP